MLPIRISLFFNSDIPAVIITLSRGVNPVHLPIFSHTQVYCPLKEENVRGSSDFFLFAVPSCRCTEGTVSTQVGT